MASSQIKPADLPPGSVIEGFRIEQRLHRGGMATVWAVCRVDAGAQDMPLVMKVPHTRHGEDPTAVVGYEVERLILPLLQGIHVPRYVASGDFLRQPFIVMERIAGSSLKPRLGQAPLPLTEVADIGARVATALEDLHRQQLVHLDVKPSNIMIRSGGEVVMIDFGLSRHAQRPDLLDEQFRLPLGTGPYMSPEQVQFVRDDPRSDLFALGVMLYHLATGKRPFGAPETVRGLRRRLFTPPTPPRMLRADLPPWLQEIILRCLEVDPKLRHSSAAELAFDLSHGDQVVLTARSERLDSGGRWKSMRRWAARLGNEPAPPLATAQPDRPGPVLLVAVDAAAASQALLEALRRTVQRMLHAEPDARLACIAVMREHGLAGESASDPQHRSHHVALRVKLEQWVHPLGGTLDLQHMARTGRLTFHVLEAQHPAAAIVEHARRNAVDHIVMGARSSGSLRRYLGSVSAQVVAQADCSVTVVRAAPDPARV